MLVSCCACYGKELLCCVCVCVCVRACVRACVCVLCVLCKITFLLSVASLADNYAVMPGVQSLCLFGVHVSVCTCTSPAHVRAKLFPRSLSFFITLIVSITLFCCVFPNSCFSSLLESIKILFAFLNRKVSGGLPWMLKLHPHAMKHLLEKW